MGFDGRAMTLRSEDRNDEFLSAAATVAPSPRGRGATDSFVRSRCISLVIHDGTELGLKDGGKMYWRVGWGRCRG